MNSSWPSERSTVLMVDDDARLATLVSRYLQSHGLHVDHQLDAMHAAAHILSTQPDLVLLDIDLPDGDGLDICRQVRQEYRGILCIFSARADDIHQVLGLELGADDYITKPVEPRVLLARLRAHIRRSQAAVPPAQIVFGTLQVDLQERRVRLGGRIIDMTTAEFDLLALLASNAGRIMDRDSLLRQLRGFGFDGMDRSMDARISRLRRRLGDCASEPVRIRTIRGRGYLFSRTDWN